MGKRRYIQRMLRMAVLAVGMVLAGGASAWGQNRITPTYPDDNENSSRMGRSTEVIYATSGDVTIQFQAVAADCIDGFVRWYVEDGDGNESTTGIQGTFNNATNGYRTFSNGIVWVNPNGTTAAPGNINSITYHYNGNSSVTVVCEGSSIYNDLPNNGNWTTPEVSIQRRYEIRPASERYNVLSSNRTSLNNAHNSWTRSIADLMDESVSTRSSYFLEDYEVHVPLGRNVTFRLSEDLPNYYVDNAQQANRIRWRLFNTNGSFVNSRTVNRNTNGYTTWYVNVSNSGFEMTNSNLLSSTSTTVVYLIAEVLNASDNYNSFPVAFIKLYVEPNSDPLTERQLTTDDAYEHRTTEYLEQQGYINIANLNFDDINGDGSDDLATPTAANNFAEDPMPNANSYYAYAYPSEFLNRKDTRLSVGRQEYGLYRTLNMEDVSRSEPTSDGDGHNRRTPLEITSGNYGVYNEYFTARKEKANYNRIVVDKTYAANGYNGNAGFFLYLDAADEPGVITNIQMHDRLCNDMRLVVTAWVCDMSASDNASNRIFADVGLTFKGVREGQETVLNRYFSGEIGRPEYDSSDGGYALWQQIYFTFNYSGTEEDYDYFVLEISNNSRGSNGADYGIDDIQVWRSTPRVDVRRMEACDASTLTVNTDYETILANMGWTAGQEVAASASRPAEYAQYGYGLPNDYYGNIYFAFLEGLREDLEGNIVGNKNDATNLDYASAENLSKDIVPRTLPSSGNQYRWVRVNRNLTVPSYQSVYSFRTIITTNENDIPRGADAQARALVAEKKYNFQAVLDYNADNNQTWAGDDNTRKGTIDITANGTITTIENNDGLIASGTLTKDNITDSQYDEIYTILTEALYSRLQIPRIRCPWFETVNGEEMLFLYEMNVEHTDLMYAGEQYVDEQGEIQEASGQYFVMVFSGQQISDYDTPKDVLYEEISNTCSLVSSFLVQGSLVIRIDTETDPSVLACAGTLRKISATLKNLDTGGDLDANYSFDWFFGSLEEYNAITFDGTSYDLQGAINYVRNQLNKDSFTSEDLEDWEALVAGESAIKEKLIELMNPENPKIAIDKNDFDWVISSEQIVAMPFVKTDDVDTNLYCTDIQEAPVPLYSVDVPELHPGYTMTTNPFKGEVALRLGHPNMDTQMELKIPLQSGFESSMADEAQSLRIPETGGVDISWNNIEEGYPTVGTAQQVTINRNATDAKVSITLNANAKANFHEGQRYELRIPFRQYDSNNQPLDNECDGVIILPLKVVPEYLTWKGSSLDNWYDESKWNQSTKKDLYFEGWNGANDADKDANGPDDEGNYEDIRDAYSPLYFTKITIPESSELILNEPMTTEENGHKFLNSWADDDSDSIRYEMAVADANGTIEPYYINKVDQIYFKPKALLKKQQLLTYKKAWVEFEMSKGDANWLASPLKDVFAGDMYAPKETGRQTTPAFTDIKYTDTNPGYDRWNPTFYQKAWDKGITYYTKEDGSVSDTTTVVKSNWSIEYNDVNVPYALGKGFYASTNDFENDQQQALVRLPKADDSYSYVATKVASTIANRPNAGKLAGSEAVKIVLADADTQNDWYNGLDVAYADGDGTHFLIGNPYMYPLDITKFFDGNKKDDNTDLFARKYWVLENGTTAAAVVGTPDVGFGENTGAITNLGQIAPMQAFFVELKTPLKEGESVEIQFTTEMMADAATTQSLDTRSYEATNPQLVLTASSKQGKSVSVVTKRSDASNQYESDKDAVTLLDSELDAPTVYTVAGNYAATVNAIHDYKNVPLGVYAKDGEDVELTIEGALQLVEPLYLYDAVTRSTTPINGDNFTLNLTGSSHGRYFLTTDEGVQVESDIRIYSPADGQLIIASTPSDPLKQIQVYDLNGRMVESRQNVGTTTSQIYVPGGIYIINVRSEHGEAQAKLKVR